MSETTKQLACSLLRDILAMVYTLLETLAQRVDSLHESTINGDES